MNKSDIDRLADNLEALESLGKLFSNLWYPKVKAEINDEKLRAYLTVFEDAIPGIENVLKYIRENANAIATGDIDLIQRNFTELAESLLGEISDDPGQYQGPPIIDTNKETLTDLSDVESIEDNLTSDDLLSLDQQEALESVDQEDLEGLIDESSEQENDNQTEEVELDELIVDDIEIDSDLDDITADISEEEMSSILDDHTSEVDSSEEEKSKKNKAKDGEDMGDINEIDALFE